MIGGNNVTGNNNFVAAMYLGSGIFTTNDVHVGDDGGEGYLNMTGGTFNPQSNGNGYFTISQDGGFGQIDMSGGTINASQQGLWFGVRTSNAIANFSGTAQVNIPSSNFELGWDDGTASNTSVVTQSGTSQIMSTGNLTYFGNAEHYFRERDLQPERRHADRAGGRTDQHGQRLPEFQRRNAPGLRRQRPHLFDIHHRIDRRSIFIPAAERSTPKAIPSRLARRCWRRRAMD